MWIGVGLDDVMRYDAAREAYIAFLFLSRVIGDFTSRSTVPFHDDHYVH